MSERLFTRSTTANFTAFQTEQAVPALVDVRNYDGKAAVRVALGITCGITFDIFKDGFGVNLS